MTEKLTEQFGFEQYLNSGGRWSEETFDGLMDILAGKEENPIPTRRIFLEHAEGIGERSGIKITPEEIYLYGVLSEKPVESHLSDLRLMAEVFLLRGEVAKRKLLESKYPHVNFNELIQTLESDEQRSVRKPTYGISQNDPF